MGKSFLLVVAASAAGAAYGYLGEVVASFPAPTYDPVGLAVSANYVYVFCQNSPYNIYRLDPASGSVLASFVSPFGVRTRGLGFEYGGYLWAGRRQNKAEPALVARCSENTGSIYSSFTVPEHWLYGGVECQGNPGQPGALAAVITDDSYTVKLVTRYTTAGSLLGSFSYSSQNSFGDPGWDYVNHVIWFPTNVNRMFGYTTAGSFVASFTPPTATPWGTAYLGEYLWISTTASSHRIWKVHCPAFTAVEPASLGRVKAFYR